MKQSIQLSHYRPSDYLVEHCDLRIQLFEDHALVTTNLQLCRNPVLEQVGDLCLQGEGLQTLSLALDGQSLAKSRYQISDQELRIQDCPERFLLTSVVQIHPESNTAFEGLYLSKGMFCTQCEAEGFRRITWYLDRPDVLATFSCRIEADQAQFPVLLANGNLVAKGMVSEERHFACWKDPHPKPCYLFAMVAGDLAELSDRFVTSEGREVRLSIFVQPHNLNKTEFAMQALKRSMAWDEQRFGRCYDLDCFMIVAVDHFNMGAMENKGLNIFNSACVLASPDTSTDAQFESIEAIIGHEYFHNWSGNRVTCRDWFQLSLKEGFTVYRDAEFTSDLHSRALKRIDDVNLLRTRQFAEDAGPMSHPVRPSSYLEINNFYTLTVYEKGAELVRMYATLLGEQAFRAASDLYFERFDGQAVTTEDFLACMQAQTRLDLSQFQHWYDYAGTPELRIESGFDAAKGEFYLQAKQSCPPTPGQADKPAFMIPVVLGLLDQQGQDLELRSSDPSWLPEQSLWLVTEPEQRIVFTGIKQAPLPSLLRGFSAPVKLFYDYSQAQLAFLAAHDSDSFNRWDAMQRLASQLLLAGDPEPQGLAVLTKAMANALADEQLDAALQASLLSLPSQGWLAEQLPSHDPVALSARRQAWQLALAEALQPAMLARYRQLSWQRPYRFCFADVSQRRLAQVLANYLLSLDAELLAEVEQLYYRADNQSERAMALRLLLDHGKADQAQLAQQHFYQHWQQDQQMLEFWLAVQAGCKQASLVDVQALLQSLSFDASNPNMMRSLLGQFAANSNFHLEPQANYAFLAQQVLLIDGKNPQMAARLVTALTRWRRVVEPYQGLMLAQLKNLAQQPLSNDLYEVVSKALEGAPA